MSPTILSDDPDIFNKKELIRKIREISHQGGDVGRALYEQVPEFDHNEGPNGEWVYLKPVNDGMYHYAVVEWG